jgi:hypothetical protein
LQDHRTGLRQNARVIQPINPVRMALLGCCLPAARVAGVCLTEPSPPEARVAAVRSEGCCYDSVPI